MTNEPVNQESAGRPLFMMVAEEIEASILDGSLTEGAQVPSTNELAVFHRINPATAAKGVGHLTAGGTLFKRRGIGMFVAEGARARLLARREERFVERFVDPLVAEADLLRMDNARVVELVHERLAHAGREPQWTPSPSRV